MIYQQFLHWRHGILGVKSPIAPVEANEELVDLDFAQ